MGVFTCTVCKHEYYDRRFLWEDQQTNDSRAPEVELEFGEHLEEHEVPQDIAKIGIACQRNLENHRLVVHAVADGSWADKVGICIHDEVLQANGSSLDKVEDDDVSQVFQARPLVLLVKVPNNPAVDIRDRLRRYADALRATGTAANITGTAIPIAARALGPVSAVGGICGTASGIATLAQGFSLPSGHLDQHLIAKGAVTTSVALTCTALGAMATKFGWPLLVAAVGLGVVGLGTSTTIDANMNGICLACRVEQHDFEQESMITNSQYLTWQRRVEHHDSEEDSEDALQCEESAVRLDQKQK